MPDDYPWYSVVESEQVEQGDFLFDFPIIVPPVEVLENPTHAEQDVKTWYNEYNMIILSQSCDLIHKKLDRVLMCPVWTLDEVRESEPKLSRKETQNAIREGRIVGYHMLNRVEKTEFDRSFMIADFRCVHSVPLDFVEKFSQDNKKRLRLLPPYREHLSQAFARFFMRVGLPIDIPVFK